MIKGTKGYVTAPGWRVRAVIAGPCAPYSMPVRYTPPGEAERVDWFSLHPGPDFGKRHGEGRDIARRFEIGD